MVTLSLARLLSRSAAAPLGAGLMMGTRQTKSSEAMVAR